MYIHRHLAYRPRILDLFCGAGGCSEGYRRAGFIPFGVDINRQKNYPYQFKRMDALEFLALHGHEFDAIHASPPCQRYSSISKTAGVTDDYPDLVDPLRKLLIASGKLYVIENVKGAPLQDALMLCGTMFGLNVVRHRYFETFPALPVFGHPHCNHLKKVVKHGRKPDRQKHYAAVTGHMSDVDFCRESMGISWMVQGELAESIPPAYTEYIGKMIMSHPVCSMEVAA